VAKDYVLAAGMFNLSFTAMAKLENTFLRRHAVRYGSKIPTSESGLRKLFNSMKPELVTAAVQSLDPIKPFCIMQDETPDRFDAAGVVNTMILQDINDAAIFSSINSLCPVI